MPLTDVRIRQLKPRATAYKIADDHGLYVHIEPSGSKLWRYRYRIAGKENVYALGAYPDMALAEARARRDEARALVKQGVHPAHARKRAQAAQDGRNADTFGTIARQWLETRREHWSTYYLKQAESYFARDVYPKIGRRPIRSITAADVLEVVRAVADRGAESAAINVRRWLSDVFRFAALSLRADHDPAALLKGAVIRPPVTHARALSRDEIGEFFKRLESFGGNRTTAIALDLLARLFVRTNELRRAEWEEIDIDRGLWTIPAPKMKRRRIHMVPLAAQSVELVRELQRITGAGRYLFPNMRRPRDAMSSTTVNRALEHMGFDSITGHDFRATASTHLHESGFRGELVEMQLAHAQRSQTAASYNHALYLPDRIKMMQAWSDYLDASERPAITQRHAHASARRSSPAPRRRTSATCSAPA